MTDLPLFLLALVVAYVLPGPDMVLMIQAGLSGRSPSVVAAALGLATARGLHVALSGLGLAALLAASPALYEAVRIGGAIYLALLGLSILRSPSLLPPADGVEETPRVSLAGGFRRGLLTNALNPKALLFCSVLLPQFVSPSADPAIAFAGLGAVLVATGFAFDLCYGHGGMAIGRFVGRHRVVERIERWVFGTVLIGFGLRLATA